MNIRRLKWLLVSALLMVPFVRGVYAQTTVSDHELIASYVSDIVVNTDNSIDVTETIVYNTGPQQGHGIYRDIYTYSSQQRKMAIQNVVVTDERGTPYTVDISHVGDYVHVRIGDPDVLFSGEKTYVISYHASKAIGQLADVDEIYWNATGDQWDMPIEHVEASVILPGHGTSIRSACYYGTLGSRHRCAFATLVHGVYTFEMSNPLQAYEGLTIAVGFAKGVVAPYTVADGISNFLAIYLTWIIGISLPILTFVLSLWYWYTKGRDPKGRGVIIPQYDVPDALTPMEVGGILNENVSAKNISAEIVYLATLGYLQIREVEGRIFGLIKSTDYELIKLRDSFELPNDFDQRLLLGVFQDGATTVKLSSLKNVFYKSIPPIITGVLDALMHKEYYKNLGRMKQGASRAGIVLFISVWLSIFFSNLLGSVVSIGNPFPLIVGVVLSIVIYAIISHFSPAKTEKGVATKEYILGLKEYLQIAEKDRLQFHNAPEKRPEVFEKFLPYAMVLGVTAIWAKEFKDIAMQPPSWFVGVDHSAFNTLVFVNSLNGFSSFASSSMMASPGHGGSGGGGFSGGGGGGGGGGGW